MTRIALIVLLFNLLVFASLAQKLDTSFSHSKKVIIGFEKESEPFGIVLLRGEDSEIVKIETRCNCEKNREKNTIAIQLSKTFPSETFKINYYRGLEKYFNKYSINFDWFGDSIDFQTTQITIYLKDDKVDSAIIKRASQEPQFDGEYKLKAEIDQFKVQITKTNYRIASDIWGVAKLKMPIPFGWTGDDKIVNLYFRCKNSNINGALDVPAFDDGH